MTKRRHYRRSGNPRVDPKLKQAVTAAYRLGLAGETLPAQTDYHAAADAAHSLGLMDGGHPPWN